MAYFDLFVAPIAADKKDSYATFCSEMQGYFLTLGATEVVDGWASDVPDGTLTSLPMAVKCEDGEVVTAGWIVWPDKATRDAGWAQMSQTDGGEMPFDGKRLIFGGFDVIRKTTA
ncbi:DUF1428 domain-containing protein [Anianabacter salinae]|uniref:DUF1428 domain-containing protein n=1 Tax=Anianabacter salinae TaxID=2851023 RepID=UPI00225E1F47|nr:DUF1428 domain-containing protein [Anianabacter salinae]MBV0911930.1 DUF1428 domain-containing protein [Anianabacter salinae]